MADLSKLSTQDLEAISSGNMAGVSEAGLRSIAGESAPAPKAAETSVLQDVGEGALNFGKGLLTGASNVGTGAASLPKYVGLPAIGGQGWIDRSKAANKEFMKDTGLMGSAGELVAEVAGTGGMGGGAVKAVKVLPQALNWLRGPMGAAALEGAAASGILGEGNWNDVAIGAGAGALGQKVLGGIGRKASAPSKQSVQAQQLRDMGIDVSVGQGGGNVAKAIESSLKYSPGVRTQRELPYEQIRQKVIAASQPLVDALDPSKGVRAVTGNNVDEILAGTRKAFGEQYDNVIKGKTFTVMNDTLDEFTTAALNPKHALTDQQQKVVTNFISDYATGPLRKAMDAGGPIQGEVLSKVMRELDDKAATLADRSPEMAAALRDASKSVFEMMVRQNQDVGTVFTRLAPAYKNLLTAEGAARGAKGQGKFDVGQLTTSAMKEGNEEMTKMGRLASTILHDDTVSGGGMRTAMGLTGLAAGAGAGGYYGGPGYAAAVPAAAMLALGTRGGQRAMGGQLGVQKRMAEFLKNNPTAGGVPAALMANEILE